MAKIRWTENAARNLESIHEYISQDSKIYAGRFVKALIKAALKLQTMPLRGRVVPEFDRPHLREIIYRNYRIVYRLVGEEKDVQILAVVHGARDMEALFSEDWEL